MHDPHPDPRPAHHCGDDGQAYAAAHDRAVGADALGKAIADALGRKFIEISLDRISDESEFNGYKRTDKGAKPGCIVEGIRQAGVSNPVLFLSGVDKAGQNIKGDVLVNMIDSGKNCNYIDRYLDVSFDLSDVIIIIAADSTDTFTDSLKELMEIIQF